MYNIMHSSIEKKKNENENMKKNNKGKKEKA